MLLQIGERSIISHGSSSGESSAIFCDSLVACGALKCAARRAPRSTPCRPPLPCSASLHSPLTLPTFSPSSFSYSSSYDHSPPPLDPCACASPASLHSSSSSPSSLKYSLFSSFHKNANHTYPPMISPPPTALPSVMGSMALTMKVESVYPSGWRLGKRPRRPRNWYLWRGIRVRECSESQGVCRGVGEAGGARGSVGVGEDDRALTRQYAATCTSC